MSGTWLREVNWPWVRERGFMGGGGFFVESDSYAIAFSASCEAVRRGNSMGLILEARSSALFFSSSL